MFSNFQLCSFLNNTSTTIIEFINEQLNFLEEVGLYTGDLRDVSQDNCDGDGIDRNLCDDYEYDMSTGLAAKTAFLLLAFSCFL